MYLENSSLRNSNLSKFLYFHGVVLSLLWYLLDQVFSFYSFPRNKRCDMLWNTFAIAQNEHTPLCNSWVIILPKYIRYNPPFVFLPSLLTNSAFSLLSTSSPRIDFISSLRGGLSDSYEDDCCYLSGSKFIFNQYFLLFLKFGLKFFQLTNCKLYNINFLLFFFLFLSLHPVGLRIR